MSMIRIIITYPIILITLFFIIFPKEVSAASFEISNITPTLVSSKTQEVQVSLVNIDIPTGSYLRVSFQKNDGDSYFGEISVDRNSWTTIKSTNSGDCSGYYLVSTVATSVDLYLRIGNNNPTNGDYKVKVNRFTAGCNLDNNAEMEGIITIGLPTPTPSPISTLTPTSTLSPGPAQTSSKAVYKINKSKDDAGSELTSVQIYIDGQYIHHVDDEILEFYLGNECYLGVGCDFGNHTISLRKDGYSNWEETRDILAGMSLEVNPILNKQTTASPTPTSSPTIMPNLTPRPTGSPTPLPGLATLASASDEAEAVLGTASAMTVDLTPEPVSSVNNKNKIPFLPFVLIFTGVGFIAFSVFSIIKSAKKDYTEDGEKQNSNFS